MAQVANNNIYRVEWRGVHTGWDYRIDVIIPPEEYPTGLYLDNPTIVSLPIDSIILKTAKTKYPDYFSAPEMPTLDLDINLLEIPTALSKALTQPTTTYQSEAGGLEAGVVFHLYIKYNNNDTNNPIPYRFVKSYIHYADGKFLYKPNDHSINIQPIDLNFAVLRALSFNQLSPSAFTLHTFPIIIELYSVYYNQFYAYYHVGSPSQTIQYEFVKFDDLKEWIESKATIILKVLSRNLRDSFTLGVTLPNLYKQSDDLYGAKGAQLDITDIYLLAYIKMDNVRVGGLFYKDDEQSLQQTYPNSVADFYNELAEFNLRPVKSGSLGLDMNPSWFFSIDLDINQIYDVSFSINEEKIKAVTCSLHERHDDQDTGGDIEKREATLQGSRNEASWTIPVVFNNILTNIKREIRGLGRWGKGRKGLLKNLYYIDQIRNSILDVIRVHEYAVFNLKYYAENNPSSYHSVNQPEIHRYYLERSPTPLGTQVESGIPELLSQFALRCLKGGTDVLECTVELNSCVSFSPGGDIGNPWFFENMCEYLYNITNYDINNPYISSLANNWKLLEAEVNFISETVKAKFIRLKI